MVAHAIELNPKSLKAENKQLQELTIAIKGAGEMASAVAWRLYMANIRKIYMLERPNPLAVRRKVSFCEALYHQRQVIEGVCAEAVEKGQDIQRIWRNGHICVLADPDWQTLHTVPPDVCIDAIIAKKNTGTGRSEARTVIGLGPGFVAGKNVHMVIETNRGHHLGRIITEGSAAPNTGIPGSIGGQTAKRVLRAPAEGRFLTDLHIGQSVRAGDAVGRVGSAGVIAEIDGMIRGLIRNGTEVNRGLKIGDIDPRGDRSYCSTISDKGRAIGGSVLEAILRVHLVGC